MDMAHEAPFTPPLKIERSFKRGDGGKITANNEYSAEFRTKYFLYRNARYAALKAEQTKDFGWYVLLKKMWPEWLKEGLTEISPIPMRMELDYLFRTHSAKHLDPEAPIGSSVKGTSLSLPSHCAQPKHNSYFQLISFTHGSWQRAVRGRRASLEAAEDKSDPRVQWQPSIVRLYHVSLESEPLDV